MIKKTTELQLTATGKLLLELLLQRFSRYAAKWNCLLEREQV